MGVLYYLVKTVYAAVNAANLIEKVRNLTFTRYSFSTGLKSTASGRQHTEQEACELFKFTAVEEVLPFLGNITRYGRDGSKLLLLNILFNCKMKTSFSK